MHKNLFKSTNEINVRNVEDWLLFIAQDAFDLNPSQEPAIPNMSYSAVTKDFCMRVTQL